MTYLLKWYVQSSKLKEYIYCNKYLVLSNALFHQACKYEFENIQMDSDAFDLQ